MEYYYAYALCEGFTIRIKKTLKLVKEGVFFLVFSTYYLLHQFIQCGPRLLETCIFKDSSVFALCI